MISVVIVDDHLLVADSLAACFSNTDDIVVASVAATGEEGLAAVRRHQPDVCILDQRLPDCLGTDLLPRLLSASPLTKVLLVTASDTDDVLHRALEGGAVGFLTKGQRASVLLDAVRKAAEGDVVLSPEDLRRLMPRVGTSQPKLGGDLTPREREVLGMLAQGLSTADIAKGLFLSPATVRNHIQAVLTKLDAHSKLEAVTIALREGIVAPL